MADDSIIVTLAPGIRHTVTPHPSGLPLPPLILEGGNTLTVTRAEADRLYARGQILHPVTQQPRPTPQAPQGVTVMIGGTTYHGADAILAAQAMAERQGSEEALERINAAIEERGRTVRPHYAGEQIDGAAGRGPSASPWYLNTPPDPHDNR